MDDIKNSLDFCSAVFTATEASLQSWDFSKNLQFPELLTMTQSRLGSFSPDDLKEIDPFIRAHVRRHSIYYVSRGAKGGIMLKSARAAKEAAKAAKAAAKKEIVASLDAKLSNTETTVAAE